MDGLTNYITGEITRALAQYGERRRRDKRKAILLQVATVTLSASITVLLGISVGHFTETILRNTALGLGAAITVLAAYDAFYNHRGLWIQRSITLENITELKRDLGLELAATPTLTEERAAYYLHRLNKLIRSDRRAWVRLRTAEGPAAELTGEAEATSSP